MRRSAKTLWGDGSGIEPDVAAYTSADDRVWDARLLRWDILGTLGHVEGLRAARLLSPREHARLTRALRVALRDADAGRFTLGPDDEDCHTALERRLTDRLGTLGEKVHTGRSRNDQVLAAIRLHTKEALFRVEERTLDAADALLGFARAHRDVLLPGYTHQRRAMPSTAALWAGGFAAGLLDGLLPLEAALALVDRSPLGSGAGFGVPIPLDRARTARALGFREAQVPVTAVQPSRGRVEAIVLAALWGIAHEFGKLSWDVILFSSEEFGFLRLPGRIATGSSMMPHKNNPDVFELTRAREGAVAGFLAQAIAIAGKLPSGYHRDLQLLKAPLFLGLDTVEAMAAWIAAAVPLLEVDRERARADVSGDLLATDAAYDLVLRGMAFRRAYREIAARVKRGDRIPAPPRGRLLASRRDAGLGPLSRAIATRRRSLAESRRRHDAALGLLAGGRGRR